MKAWKVREDYRFTGGYSVENKKTGALSMHWFRFKTDAEEYAEYKNSGRNPVYRKPSCFFKLFSKWEDGQKKSEIKRMNRLIFKSEIIYTGDDYIVYAQ